MNSAFKDTFNYIVAFIAVLIGLSTFKDVATSNSIIVLSHHINYLQLSIPFIASMLLAAYVGALAMLSKNINFSLFPLTRYLENASYALATAGLLYPLLVLITWVITQLSSMLVGRSIALVIQLIVLLSQVILMVAAIRQLAISKSRFTVEREVDHIRSITMSFKNKKSLGGLPKESQFIKKYEEVSESTRALLRAYGYGAAKDSLNRTARTLVDKRLFNEKDLSIVKRVVEARNEYAHTGEGLSLQNLDTLIEDLERLQKKINEITYDSTVI